jgi:periplasmic copper chaperone A
MRRHFTSEKTLMKIISSITLLAAFAIAGAAHANEIRIGQATARPTVPGQTVGAVYLTLENTGKKADQLTAVSSPLSKSAEIHTMSMEGNVMQMREVSDIALEPATRIEMKPGSGYHIMLLGLKQPLRQGESFPLSLSFRHAGKLSARVTVQAATKSDGREKQGSAHAH